MMFKRIFGKNIQVDNNNWEIYHWYNESGLLGLISFDQTYIRAEDRKNFSKELKVIINIPESRQFEQLPTPDEQQFQLKIEGELIELLQQREIDCKHVGRRTDEGKRQFIFECNDMHGLVGVIDFWKGQLPEYQIQYVEGIVWENYIKILPDEFDWQQIGNSRVIEQLINAGSNEEKEHLIEHAIFGSVSDLESLKMDLEGFDFKFISLNEGILEMGCVAVLDLDEVTDQTSFLIEKSIEYSCKYNGWQTGIVK